MTGTKKGIQIALAILMIVLVAAGLTSAGCGGGDGGGPVGNQTHKVKLSIPHPITPTYLGAPASDSTYYWYEKAVETVTEGRIDMEIYASETLNKQELAYDAAASGITDIAWVITSYQPAWVPEDLVFYLPLDMNSAEKNYQVKMLLHDEYAADAYEERNLLHATSLGVGAYIIFSPKKPLNTVQDFKGMTIMTSGKSMEQLISKLGALSITLAWQDCYEALEKGTIDLTALQVSLIIGFRWYETGDPGYVVDVGGVGNAKPDYVVRSDFLTNYRPEDVYAMLKLLDVWCGARSSQWSDAGNILYMQLAHDLGLEVSDWPESEKQKLRDMKNEVYFDWYPQWLEAEYGVPQAETVAYVNAVLQAMDDFERGNPTPAGPTSYPEQWMVDMLAGYDYTVDQAYFDEWVGPDGHWGMDYVYMDGWEPWYEKWWDDQGLGEHPWYANWKAEHGD